MVSRGTLVNNRKGGRKLPKMYKKKAREVDLKNIIWYSSYESSKNGKFNTFLVSFNIPF